MISANICIRTPWFTTPKLKNMFNYYCMIYKFKAFEFEVCYDNSKLLSIILHLQLRGSDHAGPYIEFGLFGFDVTFKIYDTRHWNYNEQTWETYDNET